MALLPFALWLSVLLPASSKDVYLDGGGSGGVGGFTSMGSNSVVSSDVAPHRDGSTVHPRSKEYDDFRRRFDEMAKSTEPVPGTGGALRYRFTPNSSAHETWHWSLKTRASATGNASASAGSNLGDPSRGGSVTSHAESDGMGSASASASSSGSITIAPGGISVASAPPPEPDVTAAPAEVAATPIVAAVLEQPAPSIIILEPPPRPPRIITTNDLPHSAFGGVAFDERAAVLNYQSQQAARGNPEALYAMGIRFLNGIDVIKNAVLARDYLEAAKKKGNLRARAKLEELARTKREGEANPPTQVGE